jgi:phosphatidylglycerophosphate synthase
MGKALKAVKYLVRLLTDKKFREELPWVQYIADILSIIPKNVWTSFRFPGYLIVKIASYYSLLLTLSSFVFLLATDLFDGLVARRKEQQNGRRGALLDAVADKCFILPLIADWGHAISPSWYFWFEMGVIISIEASNLLLPLLEKRGLIKSGMLYEHLKVGQWKFVFQGLLGGMLIFANFIFPGWPIWEYLLHSLMGVIILLSFLSVAGKINRFRSLK